jgi:hypothetical protein
MTHRYVYAVIPSEEQGIFDVGGVGNNHDEVYSIANRNVAAIVSASPLADFRGLKREQAVRYLVAHQRVVETVMQDFAVLPVKFGTVLPDETWVHRLLVQGETLFRTTLEQIANRVQMEVVVLWNLQKVFLEIGQEAHIAQLKQEIAGRPDEETLVERIAVGQMVQAALEQRRAALHACVVYPLRELALDLVVNPSMDDSMVANLALLLDQAGQEALDRQLEILDQEFEGRLLFRRVGPLPPYSFATVEVETPSFEAIDGARRRLGLRETATSDDSKRAYHRLAGQLHPDHNRQDPDAEARMTELAQAYELLTAYAETAQGSSGAAEHPSGIPFSREVVEGMLLIRVRRQGVPV